PAVLFLNTVVTTRRLSEACLQIGVERFVLVSSLAVYGTSELQRGHILDESCPIDPHPFLRDAYTYSKINQEHVAWAAQRERDLPLVVIRPGVIYGPGRDVLTGRVGLRIGRLLVRMG